MVKNLSPCLVARVQRKEFTIVYMTFSVEVPICLLF
jgi:hypothetical protein